MITEHNDTPIVVREFIHNTVMNDVDALARLMTTPMPTGSDPTGVRSNARLRISFTKGALIAGALWLGIEDTYSDAFDRLWEMLQDLPTSD